MQCSVGIVGVAEAEDSLMYSGKGGREEGHTKKIRIGEFKELTITKTPGIERLRSSGKQGDRAKRPDRPNRMRNRKRRTSSSLLNKHFLSLHQKQAGGSGQIRSHI